MDEEFLNRQEAQSELAKCEEKIVELQAELQAFKSQVRGLLFLSNCVYCYVGLTIQRNTALNNEKVATENTTKKWYKTKFSTIMMISVR